MLTRRTQSPLRFAHVLRVPALWMLTVCVSTGVSALPQAERLTLGSPPPTMIEAQGFSAERLKRIDARMLEAVADGRMVGGHGVIARKGQVVYDQTWGMADREAGRMLENDALYRVYSMTKPITAVALMMLYEEGHFLLEDPVGQYLPELANLQLASANAAGEITLVAPIRQPTIRDLLRHTAGLSYGVFSDSSVDQQYRDTGLMYAKTLNEFTVRLGKLPLIFEPGTRWHYSVAVDVQGRLIEAISGMAFGEFLQQRVFEPLDMRDTSFVVPADKRSRLTQLYSPLGNSMSWDAVWKFTTEQILTPADPEISRPFIEGGVFESGGAGLVSTTRDYLRFALMLANDGELGGTRLLSPRTVAHMRSNHIRGVDNSGLWGLDAFGLGVGISADTAAVSGELGADGAYGWGGAAGTLFWVDPRNDIVGVFMLQSIPHQTNLSKKFRVLTYQALVD